jgi:hypothetical protein
MSKGVADQGAAFGDTHPDVPAVPFAVAPTSSSDFNALRSFLIPKACWLVEDGSFEFDSSFVNPITFFEDPLIDLLDKHPGAKLSVFGHADPTGDDDYNKVLSGRRAQAIFGLLTREVRLWEDLYYTSDARGKDDWTPGSVQIMLNVLQFRTGRFDGVIDEPTRDALRRFERSKGLAERGFGNDKRIARETFRALVPEYMDAICNRDDGTPFILKPTDFLAQGRRSDGKGDMQGCGEFNPRMVFSKSEKAILDRDENKRERNRQNAVNRRVMVLLFRAGSQIDPTKWPCPTVKEGASGCRKRFFSDGEQRRANTDERRTFEQTQKAGEKGTFACRFYERFVTKSPCELIRHTFRIRLYDAFGQFMANAPCEVTIGAGAPFRAAANSRGLLTLRDVEAPVECKIKWGHEPTGQADPILSYEMNVLLPADTQSQAPEQQEEARKKLNNLGYVEPELAANVETFQLNYGHLADPELEPTGELDDATLGLLRQVYDQAADHLRDTDVEPQGA